MYNNQTVEVCSIKYIGEFRRYARQTPPPASFSAKKRCEKNKVCCYTPYYMMIHGTAVHYNISPRETQKAVFFGRAFIFLIKKHSVCTVYRFFYFKMGMYCCMSRAKYGTPVGTVRSNIQYTTAHRQYTEYVIVYGGYCFIQSLPVN